jgi:hypothetical protein
MTDYSDLKRMAECATGFTDMSLAPDVVLGLIAENERLASMARMSRIWAEMAVHEQVGRATTNALLVMWDRDQLKAENTKLLCHVQTMIDQTTPLVPVPGDPMWSRRITINELRAALAECTASLEGEILQKYHGQKPEDMHPVTRRDYDRDMAEINGYKALSKEG